MCSEKMTKIVGLVLVAMVLVGSEEAAISCGTVASKLVACVQYLKSGKPSPFANGCCNGVKALNSMARNVADRQAACRCMKQQIATVKPKPQFIAALPRTCGVNLGYPISVSTNWNTY